MGSHKVKRLGVQAHGVRERTMRTPGAGWSKTGMTDKTPESGVRGEPRTASLAEVVLLFAHARMSVPRADKDKFHCG